MIPVTAPFLLPTSELPSYNGFLMPDKVVVVASSWSVTQQTTAKVDGDLFGVLDSVLGNVFQAFHLGGVAQRDGDAVIVVVKRPEFLAETSRDVKESLVSPLVHVMMVLNAGLKP